MTVPNCARSLSRLGESAVGARVVQKGVLGIALLLLPGCRDVNDASRLTVAPTSRHDLVSVNPDSAKWDRFEADVVVSVEGHSLLTAKQKQLTAGVSYRLIRYRDPNRQWVTEQQFDDLIPRSASGSRSGPPRLARIVTAPGTPAALYDQLGRRMVVPSEPKMPVRRIVGPVQPQPPGSLPRLVKVNEMAPSEADTSSDWLDRYMVTASSRARVRDRLIAERGAPTRGSDGHSRFVARRGSLETEIELNDARGTIDIVRTKAGGRTVQEAVHEYQQRTDGAWVLKTERVSRFDDKGNPSPAVLVTTYRDIRISEAR